MAELKHVGRNVANKRKCIVAYRVVPHAPEYCLVVHTESLDADQHDTLIKLVESNAGQSAYELAEAMGRTRLPDGRNMLQAFHTQGKLTKTLSKDIEMVPNQQTTINLAELNKMIAEARGVTVEDLALGITTKKEKVEAQGAEPEQEQAQQPDPAEAYAPADDDLLTDEKLAAQYRSQAEVMLNEAKQLQEQADQLDPPKKKAPARNTKSTTKSTTKSATKSTTAQAKKKETSG